MKLLIDIPDKTYVNAKNGMFNTVVINNAVVNGTLIEHGDLCYKEDVKANHRRWLGYLDEDMVTRLNIAVDRDVKAIKVDKEQSDE